ncbi:MAG: hypothetical protein DI587_35465 [Variovorax paradoxus]|nr:MAG: hypothetical protein DI583_35465 [Variovorax paradoxus]PZQ01221.1 MAG: hypothetical protein DI587_35465 [Variovorax paradoxus]
MSHWCRPGNTVQPCAGLPPPRGQTQHPFATSRTPSCSTRAAQGSIHPVMRDRYSPIGVVQSLPAHPHEGAVDPSAFDPAGAACSIAERLDLPLLPTAR